MSERNKGVASVTAIAGTVNPENVTAGGEEQAAVTGGARAYIGVKLIEAYPEERGGEPGYVVRYADGYESWSPAETFEAAYLPLDEADPTRITEDVVDGFIAGGQADRMENHTVICMRLANGFSVVEDSACVDPNNFDIELGARLAVEKVRRQVWAYLGFVLAWAKNGLARPNTPESDERTH